MLAYPVPYLGAILRGTLVLTSYTGCGSPDIRHLHGAFNAAGRAEPAAFSWKRIRDRG